VLPYFAGRTLDPRSLGCEAVVAADAAAGFVFFVILVIFWFFFAMSWIGVCRLTFG
jgi:hypothetical protein